MLTKFATDEIGFSCGHGYKPEDGDIIPKVGDLDHCEDCAVSDGFVRENGFTYLTSIRKRNLYVVRVVSAPEDNDR